MPVVLSLRTFAVTGVATPASVTMGHQSGSRPSIPTVTGK
jgi:hypothetical protein